MQILSISDNKLRQLTALFYVVAIVSFTLLILVNLKTLKKLRNEEEELGLKEVATE